MNLEEEKAPVTLKQDNMPLISYNNDIEENDREKREALEERKEFEDSRKELITNKNTKFTTNHDSKLRNNDSKDLIMLNPQERI